MPKTTLPFDDGSYAPVANRITLFRERHPAGRIDTEMIERGEVVVFKASVYRELTDPHPAATGWAAERVGDGEINAVACVENTETSAVGRALANLGFTASTKRPSLEEMEKAARERARLVKPAAMVAEPAPPSATTTRPAFPSIDGDPLQRRANAVHDVLHLIGLAEALGFPVGRARVLRTILARDPLPPRRFARLERRIRGWVSRHRRTLY